MALTDLRTFVAQLEAHRELKVLHGADRNLEIGAITELCLQNNGPALLFDQIPGFPPNYRVASNVCSAPRRSLLALGLDPDLPEEEALRWFRQKMGEYRAIPPREVDRAPLLENVETGDATNLEQFPVPVWHELDGAPYIGTGVAVIQQDPDTGFVNVGTYRGQLHDRRTTGIFFTQQTKDGAAIMRKYWAQGKACPVAVSYGPEPLLFLSACSTNGLPRGTAEYDYTGFLCGEPVPVIRGSVTGLPISAGSEIAIEGEIPPLDTESRDEGPFGEWTGYYWGIATKEPVIRVKALYYRNDPILLGAPPLRHPDHYVFGLRLQGARGDQVRRLQELGLPVRRVHSFWPLGPTVVTVEQQKADDVDRVIEALDKMTSNNRLILVVDDDVNPTDPWEVLWAVSTRLDPDRSRTSSIRSTWNLDPQMTLEQRTSGEPAEVKRLIVNGCRPFERLDDYPPVNIFSRARRQEVWKKWGMDGWLPAAGRQPLGRP